MTGTGTGSSTGSGKVRVYLPTTLGQLRGWREQGTIGPAPLRAHAVTEELRTSWAEASEEEWEYVALMQAADESATMLTDDQPPRRVVLALDVTDVVTVSESTEVEIPTEVPMRLLAAVHADADDIDPRDEDAGDLGWYGVQELPFLLST